MYPLDLHLGSSNDKKVIFFTAVPLRLYSTPTHPTLKLKKVFFLFLLSHRHNGTAIKKNILLRLPFVILNFSQMFSMFWFAVPNMVLFELCYYKVFVRSKKTFFYRVARIKIHSLRRQGINNSHNLN